MQLQVQELSKYYGSKRALDHFTYTFQEGIYGILGANGAGKSTLMNLITDNVKRTGGSIFYNGEEILSMGRKFRSLIGYMPQQQGMYEQFSARAFLFYMAEIKGLKKKKQKNKQRNSFVLFIWKRMPTESWEDFPAACVRECCWPRLCLAIPRS